MRFETPHSLDNEEIQELQKESKRETLSAEMEKRFGNREKKKTLLEEYVNYMERSRNEQSRKRIGNMFRTIFSQIGTHLTNDTEGIERAKEQISSSHDVQVPSIITDSPTNEQEPISYQVQEAEPESQISVKDKNNMSENNQQESEQEDIQTPEKETSEQVKDPKYKHKIGQGVLSQHAVLTR